MTYIVITLLLLLTSSIHGQSSGYKGIDHYNFIDVNDCLMWIGNNGSGAHDPRTDGNGFHWPSPNWKNGLIFQEGLVWGGLVDGKVRANGSTHRQGLRPGKILFKSSPDTLDIEKNRIYKIRKNWETLPPGPSRDAYEKDYNEWPGNDGAPYIDRDGDGFYTRGIDLPEHKGDQTLWCISNDLDTTRTRFTYGSDPIGLEIQTTVYAFQYHNFLDSVIFKEYTIINKSENKIEEMFLGYWVDSDLGFAQDDYYGCDTTLQLGFTYNGDEDDDDFFGMPPPALGHVLLKSPKDANGHEIGMSSYSFFPNSNSFYVLPSQGVYSGSLEYYEIMKGNRWNGEPIIDPLTNATTKFPLSGDPISGEGWYCGEGWPNGINPFQGYYFLSSGPFDFAPGDTQKVVIGIVVSRGKDHHDSITKMKQNVRLTKYFYENYEPAAPPPYEPPLPSYFELNQNYPNPFNPTTVIEYSIPSNVKSERANVILIIYDILGRKIATLVNKEQSAGNYEVSFDASGLASGVYIYNLSAGPYFESKKMILMQ